MSIKLRLMLLIATGLLTALIMSLASYLGNTRMAEAVKDNEVSMTALRNHMEADMMHDALRADVLSAMLVGLGKSTSTKAEVRVPSRSIRSTSGRCWGTISSCRSTTPLRPV